MSALSSLYSLTIKTRYRCVNCACWHMVGVFIRVRAESTCRVSINEVTHVLIMFDFFIMLLQCSNNTFRGFNERDECVMPFINISIE